MSVETPLRVVKRLIGSLPRRGLWGLLLLTGCHCAVAADERVHAGDTQNFSLVQTQATNGLAALLESNFQVAAGSIPLPGQSLVAEGDLTRLLALNVDQRVLGALTDGVGVNFSMGDWGGLSLNLYSRRNAKGPGKRWNLNPAGPYPMASAPRFWSLGGSLDLVRNSDGRKHIVFVPQLLLDFDALTGSHNRLVAFMQYANWRPGLGQAAQDEKIPQVALRLQF